MTSSLRPDLELKCRRRPRGELRPSNDPVDSLLDFRLRMSFSPLFEVFLFLTCASLETLNFSDLGRMLSFGELSMSAMLPLVNIE